MFPGGASDMAQPGGSKIERRLPVWERADDTCAPSDLAQNTLERIVGANAPQVFRKRQGEPI